MTDASDVVAPTAAEVHAAALQLMGQRFKVERDALANGKSLDEAFALGRDFESARTKPADAPVFDRQSLEEQQRANDARVHNETIDYWADRYGLNTEVREHLKAGNKVSAEEVRAAEQWLERAAKDRAWVARFRGGDQEAQRQWFLASSIIGGDIK